MIAGLATMRIVTNMTGAELADHHPVLVAPRVGSMRIAAKRFSTSGSAGVAPCNCGARSCAARCSRVGSALPRATGAQASV